MSVAFTDALIALSSPLARLCFIRDPENFLKGRDLTEAEVKALLTGDSGPLWLYARSTAVEDPDQQFNRFAIADDLLIEIEPMVEQHTENNDQIAVSSLGPLVVDGKGQVYRVVDDDRGQ